MKYLASFEILFEARAVSRRVERKEHSLIDAAEKGEGYKIKELVKSGADINIQDKYGLTPLMKVCNNSYLKIVDYLIKAGADVNIQDNRGHTALAHAKTITIISRLLKAKTDVNIINLEGMSAAMEVIMSMMYSIWFKDIFEMLIQAGMNLDIRNNKDKNTYDLLKEKEELYSKNWETAKTLIGNFLLWFDEKFPKYKEEWELNNDIKNYNV